MKDRLSAAIVCGSAFLREVVSDTLQTRGVDVVFAVEAFSEVPREAQPEILVVVETMPGELEIPSNSVGSLAQNFQKWLFIGSTDHGSAFQRLRAIRSDISGVPLDIGKDEIYHAVVLAAHANSLCIGDTVPNFASSDLHRLHEARLNKGQWQILKLLADGATNKHIAQEFECEENQVKSMIRRLLSSINANNRTQAAVIAARAGL